MKIRNKITLLFTGLVAFILLVTSVLVYYLSSVESNEIFKKRLRTRASNNAQIIGYLGDSSIAMLRRIDAGALATLPRKSVWILDTSYNTVYEFHGDDTKASLPDTTLFPKIRDAGEMNFNVDDRNAIGIFFQDSDNAYFVIVAAYDEDGKQRLTQLKKVLLLCMIIGLLVTVITGFLFSSELVKPIALITKEVNDISSHNLFHRLHTGSGKDELSRLAMTFNDLLDRLQESFNIQRRFISNASHELSTPLTSISSQLQVTLQKERNTHEYHKILTSIQEDVEQMRQLTKSLLEIAKTGSQGSIELKKLRIDELLLKIIADIQRINPSYSIDMQFDSVPEDESQCMVFGNADLLYIAIKNIVENGCKYSTDHISRVKVSFTGNNIVIDVINNGDIISEEEIEQIFQPFFRGQNAMQSEGFGLGLPLAKRIIAIHKGEIKVRSGDDGTTFSIIIPTIYKQA